MSDPAAGPAMTRRRLPIQNDVGQHLPSNGAEAHLVSQHDVDATAVQGATFHDLIAEHAARHRAGARHY